MTVKKICMLCLALLFIVSASAQRKKVFVAVIGNMEDPVVGEALADELMYAFSNSLLYTPLERSKEILAVLTEEQSFQRSGEVLERDIIAIAKKYGAAYACIVNVRYSPTLSTNQIAARLVDVQTSEAVNSAKPFRSRLSDENEISKSAEILAEALGGKITKDLKAEEAERQRLLAIEQEKEAERRRQEEAQAAAEAKRLQQMREDGYTQYRDLYVQLRPTDEMSWSAAQDICSGSKRGKLSGWRLPTVGELSTLYDNQSTIWGNYSTFNSNIWSSSNRNCDKGYIAVGAGNKKTCVRKFARCICVRDVK